ncbi:LLM class flavin-dependent oxidoreductase [Flavisphingomonas formosensis]|uniref:LLM class flavin-dependent oxidoreductase n=1 Tax=Flavisphingomonas formosensis TaxID=861534 RepID=UPI0012F749CF|nr:LLM class flavin-dependent oxidoreductase [Sphingomonas formosensis]
MKFTLSVGFCPVDHYLPLAMAGDASGWNAVSVPDGLFYFTQSSPYPYSADGHRFWPSDTPFLDPFAVVAAMGAVTQRIAFYTNVLKLPVRHPLLVAKAATSASALTKGRFGLGVGLSPWKEDFDVLGEDWRSRGPRSAEMVEIIRGISRGGRFEHEGEHYTIPSMEISPAAVDPFPIYFGGLVDAVFQRAARLGDGYIWWENAKSGLADFPAIVAALRDYLAANERKADGFEIKAFPSSTKVDDLRRLADAGMTDLIVMPWYFYAGDPNDLGFRIDCVRRFAEDHFALFG